MKNSPSKNKLAQEAFAKKYELFIAKRNEKFHALPREKRIVAICEDAIASLFNNISKGKSGVYVGISQSRTYTNNDIFGNTRLINENIVDDICSAQIQQILPRLTHSCEVCEKGQMLISCVSFRNKVKVKQAEYYHFDSVPKIMRKDFTKDELDILEVIFEKYDTTRHRRSSFSVFHKMEKETKVLYEEDEFSSYGEVYCYKHFKASSPIKFINDRSNSSVPNDTLLLLQISANVIANNGNIFEAVSLKNDKTIPYEKIFKTVMKKYPVSPRFQESLAGKLAKVLRDTPLKWAQLSKK